MKSYEFTSNGRTFTRVNKTVAKKAFINGLTIVFCPCSLRPGTPWHPEYTTNRKMRDEYIVDDKGAENDFNNLLNSFEYYNCNSTETGRYTAFFIEENIK